MNKNNNAPFWQNIFKTEKTSQDVLIDYWQATPLFKNISRREISLLVAKMHHRHYKPEEAIFQAGDQGIGVALIFSGQVEIKSQQKLLATLVEGDFFGEVALISNDSRTADAFAANSCHLVFFLRQDLEEWMDQSPKLASQFLLNLSKVLSDRLRHCNQLLGQG